MKRRASEQRGVSILFALFPAAGIDAPSIADDEHDGLRHIWRTLLMIGKIDKRFFR
jgi:hypothetical protein